MKKVLLSLAVINCLFSCKNTQKDTENEKTTISKTYANLEKSNWLIGKWGSTSAEGVLSENWVKINDSVYKGETYFVVKNDTVFSESVKLEEANGKLAYIVTVPDQNNAKPVRFDMTSINNDSIVFENPQHDYPNKLKYTKVTNDSIVAQIYGTHDGKPATEIFAMARQK